MRAVWREESGETRVCYFQGRQRDYFITLEHILYNFEIISQVSCGNAVSSFVNLLQKHGSEEVENKAITKRKAKDGYKKASKNADYISQCLFLLDSIKLHLYTQEGSCEILIQILHKGKGLVKLFYS